MLKSKNGYWQSVIVVLNIALLAAGDFTCSIGGISSNFQVDDDDDIRHKQHGFSDHKALIGGMYIELLERKTKPIGRSSAPTLLLVSRVCLVLLREGPTIRTRLGFLSNVNYSSVMAQLDWLEAMGFVGYITRDKEYARLTSAGINFAKRLHKLQRSQVKSQAPKQQLDWKA